MNSCDLLSLEEKNNNNKDDVHSSIRNRSKPKPFCRVVSSSSTSLTPSQVNLLVIKSTPMYLLPKESGLIMKMDANDFPFFTASQVLLLPTLTWVDQFRVKAGISNLRPRELDGGGVGCIWEDSLLVTSTRSTIWKSCSNVAPVRGHQKDTTCI